MNGKTPTIDTRRSPTSCTSASRRPRAAEQAAETAHARRLAERYRLPFVDLSQFSIDHELFRAIPADLMLRYGFVPYRREGTSLVIVVSDPTDLPMIDELAVLLATPIKVTVGTPSAIQSILKKSESSQRVLEEATESFQLQILREDELADEQLTVEKLTADQSPVIRLVDTTLYSAIQRRASDIHIETQDDAVHVKYRIDGVLQAAMRPIDKRFHSTIISRVKVMAELDIAEKRVPQDGRFKVRMGGKSIDFRVSIMPSVHGEDAVIRILDKESISEQFHELRLDILGFPEDELRRFRKYIAEPYGMVLVTGPTGSGKTTTLYAALSEIKSIEDKIITIEDPVEYQLRGITQIPINEKKGLTFARGLRSILRHDPDKIMVGEIRDAETAQIAINSALTGHLVFTTVHANNVLDVLGRFLNMGVEAYQFVSALNCVLAQRLVRNICVHCKRRAVISRTPARGVGARSRAGVQRPVLRRGGLHRVRRHGLQGTDRHLRAARSDRQHPRDDPRQAADLRDQEGGPRRGDAVPARERGRAGAARQDDAARNQQGDVRRMSQRSSFPLRGLPARPLRSRSRSPRPGCSRWRSRHQGGSHIDCRLRGRSARSGPGDAGAERVERPRRARSGRGGRRRPAEGRLTHPAHRAGPARLGREGLADAVREGSGEAAGSRAADSLADAQGGAVPDRGRAGVVAGCVVASGRRTRVPRDRGAPRHRPGYERACDAAGAHAGLVDIASFNQINAVLAGRPSGGDWLLVNVAPDYATLAVVRDDHVIFFRNRSTGGIGDLPDLVHQTAMYHEDRLGGGGFRRVVLAGASVIGAEEAERFRRMLEERIGMSVEPIDFRPAAELRDRIAASRGAARHAGAGRRRAAARPGIAAVLSVPHGSGAGGLVLRTNLSTRPFYNERAVHLLLALAAVVVVC